MKHLILYAHPNPKSFNHAVLERVEANLKRDRKEYVVRDLYSLSFKPALDGADFVAMGGGHPKADVAEEQRHIANADRIIVIHPIWWFGMPAILKGYIDRVFTAGFAYEYTDKGPVGLLTGKRVVILNTTGGPRENYEQRGFRDAIIKAADVGTYEFCGLTVEEHKFFYGVPSITQEARVAMLDEIKGMNL